VGVLTSCRERVGQPPEIKTAYTPTGSFFVASSCRSTYCRIPPFA
jgi:hypothetical protein